MRWLSLAAAWLTACDFEAHEGPVIPDAQADADDAAPVVGVVHVMPDDQRVGTDDLMIGAPIAIDTTAMTVGQALPSGVTFAIAQQPGGGPGLAILHVRAFTVRAQVRVTGDRPLVVIADAIDLGGVIDAGAHHQQAGPGAASSGAGGGGQHLDMYTDSGGGGGSYGSAGAAGGATSCDRCSEDPLRGGSAGAAYNAGVVVLTGGSPGGRAFAPAMPPAGCDPRAPGGGGGAIELYARTQLVIQSGGGINAGGGGGLGGDDCSGNWLAGHGGGSGGAIVLQAAVIDNRGQLSANAGGGGAGAGANGPGGDGDDAAGIAIARGGTATGQYSAAGGAGAVQGTPAGVGAFGPGSGNAGGGGGGLGQIVLYFQATVAPGQASPDPVLTRF